MKIIDVKCDEDGCGWRDNKVKIKDWLNKKCPKCGKGVIITRSEMKIIARLAMIEKAVIKLGLPLGPVVKVDIGPMRKGLPPKVTMP